MCDGQTECENKPQTASAPKFNSGKISGQIQFDLQLPCSPSQCRKDL